MYYNTAEGLCQERELYPALAMTRESALSNSCGFGLPCFVYSIEKSASFATRCSMTTFLAFIPLGTLMPQDFLAEVAERYSGWVFQIS